MDLISSGQSNPSINWSRIELLPPTNGGSLEPLLLLEIYCPTPSSIWGSHSRLPTQSLLLSNNSTPCLPHSLCPSNHTLAEYRVCNSIPQRPHHHCSFAVELKKKTATHDVRKENQFYFRSPSPPPAQQSIVYTDSIADTPVHAYKRDYLWIGLVSVPIIQSMYFILDRYPPLLLPGSSAGVSSSTASTCRWGRGT